MLPLIHEVERAYKVAVCGAPLMRYKMLLNRLATHVLRVAVAVHHGDDRAARLLVYIAGRIGWMLHGQNSALLDESEAQGADALALAGRTIARDCARELLRREGYLQKFAPHPDPFGALWPTHRAKVEMSASGLRLEGEAKRLLRAACDEDEVTPNANS